MAYDVMTITTKGAQVFSQLSGDPNEHLVIEGCATDTSVKTQAQAEVVENVPSPSVSTTNHIVLSGVTNTSFLVYAQFIAGQTTGGQVNSFYLFGYLQSAPNTKFVIAVASDSRQTKLPATQDIVNYVEVRFSLTFIPIQNTSQISTPSDNDYVLRSEFLQNINTVTTNLNSISSSLNTLSGRVVTTHVEGSATTGEAQNVYGNKTFKTGISSNIITPESSGTSEIGSISYPFDKADIKLVRQGDYNSNSGYSSYLNLYQSSSGSDAHVCSCQNGTYYDLNKSEIYLAYDTAFRGRFYLHCLCGDETEAGISYEHDEDYGLLLECDDQTDDISIITLYADTIKVYGNILPGEASNTYTVGDDDYPFAQVQALDGIFNSLHAIDSSIALADDLIPDQNNTISIGSENKILSHVYAGYLHGVLPTCPSTHVPDLGCILVVRVTLTSGSTQTILNFGDLIKIGSGNIDAINVSSLDGSNAANYPILSGCTFKLLSQAPVSLLTATALVMRVV